MCFQKVTVIVGYCSFVALRRRDKALSQDILWPIETIKGSYVALRLIMCS
jgi:hypothetical protein